ncbi:MAG: hypothetical protein K0M70_14965 [Arenimonas sp.]|uniref:hypothetical protein n=1 Tax=Arenimonas sp. TaxID=1872635 RepID=UPI0025C4ED85|nr:hypothetical protein [Arenimonas sp.]MBW8369145.1 hypothetical protein [Arenimonas sp.]
MTLDLRSRAAIFVGLAALMAATRMNHFGAIPDASWAVFFIAGFYLRGSVRWAFPALMAIAVAVDYAVITGTGQSFWSHYCMSPGYWFLVPAHLSMWLAGSLLRRHHRISPVNALGLLLVSVFAGVAACHLFAQGGFYWLSDTVADPTVAGWARNYADWFLPYLRTAGIYVALAAVVHVALAPLLRPERRAADTTHS